MGHVSSSFSSPSLVPRPGHPAGVVMDSTRRSFLWFRCSSVRAIRSLCRQCLYRWLALAPALFCIHMVLCTGRPGARGVLCGYVMSYLCISVFDVICFCCVSCCMVFVCVLCVFFCFCNPLQLYPMYIGVKNNFPVATLVTSGRRLFPARCTRRCCRHRCSCAVGLPVGCCLPSSR